MIRFLIIILLLSLIYLSALVVGTYDTALSLVASDYVIKINSLFFILILFVLIVSTFSLGLKFIAWIITLPFALMSKILGFRRRNQMHLLLDAYANLIMENQSEAAKQLSRLRDIPNEYKDHENFIKALANKDSEKDAYLIYERLKNKEYHAYAAKKIVISLFNKELYDQALKFIESAELDRSKDPEIIYIVMILYAELGIWDKFQDQVGLLKDKFKRENKKISSLYTNGAKYYLEDGKEKKALELLEKALEYNPASMEAIEIFCTLNNSQGLNNSNLPILEAAFSLQPSFELFELYCSSSNMKPDDLYDKFYNLVDSKKYRDVLLSIAAYLKLFDKVDSLLSCEI